MCIVSVRGEDSWVSGFKGGQHGESERVQEGQCSEAYSSAYSRGQQREENQMKEFWEVDFKMMQLKLFTVYGGYSFNTEM